jgi:hypothetical protein
MPMENIKQQLSDVIHHWTAIAMITLFLFPVQPVYALPTLPKETVKTEYQLKQETLQRLSTEKYTTKQQLTDEDLIALLRGVGFEGTGLKTAWAIAKRESNGRPLAYNGNRSTGDSSYGIFQINMIDGLGIDRLELFNEKFDVKTKTELFDPVTNAEITYYMSNGGKDWTAWKGLTPKAREWLKQFPTNRKA